jgi:hypothetical protein
VLNSDVSASMSLLMNLSTFAEEAFWTEPSRSAFHIFCQENKDKIYSVESNEVQLRQRAVNLWKLLKDEEQEVWLQG